MIPQKIMTETIEEVLRNTVYNRTDLCQCDKCRTAVKHYIIMQLIAKYKNAAKDLGHVRVQGNDIELKADAAKEMPHALNQIKQHPPH
jgi:hypothetical protein